MLGQLLFGIGLRLLLFGLCDCGLGRQVWMIGRVVCMTLKFRRDVSGVDGIDAFFNGVVDGFSFSLFGSGW
jgi:hypothetical protein